MDDKKCCKCDDIKSIKFFTKQKHSKDGYYCVCKECKKLYDKKYRTANKSKISKVKNKHYQLNKIDILNRIKQYSIEHYKIIKKYQKEYRLKNKNKCYKYQKEYRLKNKIRRNKLEKTRKEIDLLYKLKCNMRSMISNSFKRNGYNKKTKTYEILGCSFEEFKEHLESMFESWMNWDNRGLYNGELNYGWDIDHIIPLDTATCEVDIIRLNHYTNLQPLCSKVNRDVKINKI